MNLFISTATDKLYLAIFENEIKKEIIHQGKNNHTETMYDLLNNLEVNFDEIKKVYVVNGPGAYTGLRVGVIFAKTLAMKNEIDLIPVCLMEALYISNGEKKVAFDAKGKKYFTYDGENIDVKLEDEICDYQIVELLDLEKVIKSPKILTTNKIPYKELDVKYIKPAI